MTHTAEKSKGQELLHTLITKAWEDPNFKENLIANPKEEIENITEKALPRDKKLFVIDQTDPDHIYINIPAKPIIEDKELTDNQLESIAGGTSVIDTVIDTITDLFDFLK